MFIGKMINLINFLVIDNVESKPEKQKKKKKKKLF